MSLWEAILLGIIQGLTEFLPISSTAHLLVARQLLGHENPRDAFTTAIQLGTLVAVFVYFRTDLSRMARAVFADPAGRRQATATDVRLFWMMCVATVPVLACGYAFKDFIKGTLYNTPVIAAAAIFFSLVLVAVEALAQRSAKRGDFGRGEEKATWADVLLIGLFQTFALIPGASRSGVTITAGLLAGMSRSAAARFSFLLSLPSILVAGIYDTYSDWNKLFTTSADVWNLLVGAAVAGVVGYWSIGWLIGFLKRYSTYGFIAYRLALGTVIFAMLAAGWIR